jgi:hypothetical protein
MLRYKYIVCLVKVKVFWRCDKVYFSRQVPPDTILTANAVRTWNSDSVLDCHLEVTMANNALKEKQHWLILIKNIILMYEHKKMYMKGAQRKLSKDQPPAL